MLSALPVAKARAGMSKARPISTAEKKAIAWNGLRLIIMSFSLSSEM